MALPTYKGKFEHIRTIFMWQFLNNCFLFSGERFFDIEIGKNGNIGLPGVDV
jgi:hypothetical protein